MHHPELRKVAEVDDEVRQWLAETYANARTSSPHMLRDANHSAALRRVRTRWGWRGLDPWSTRVTGEARVGGLGRVA